MADRKNAVPENVPGMFFVDDQCIHCSICIQVSPENFKFNESDTYAYVYRQPENDMEVTACESAKDSCPVNAIGAD